MSETTALTDDQKNRIEETLKRIREGLKSYPDMKPSEPIHIFLPEVLDARKS